jgi:DNA-binding response OmpR family regulator
MSVDPNARLNLTKASLLVMETSQYALDAMAQILKAFGAGDVHRCLTIEDAEKIVASTALDLILIDPSLCDDAGYAFVKSLRTSSRESVVTVPVLALEGQATPRSIARCRDVGCNLIAVKPITPAALMQRIQWLIRDPRLFISAPNYSGPDRRFKVEGPPPGREGRREEDNAPTLSQSDIDNFFKPDRAAS